jgi:hypothetical protein
LPSAIAPHRQHANPAQRPIKCKSKRSICICECDAPQSQRTLGSLTLEDLQSHAAGEKAQASSSDFFQGIVFRIRLESRRAFSRSIRLPYSTSSGAGRGFFPVAELVGTVMRPRFPKPPFLAGTEREPGCEIRGRFKSCFEHHFLGARWGLERPAFLAPKCAFMRVRKRAIDSRLRRSASGSLSRKE